jgi:hypothetical protein
MLFVGQLVVGERSPLVGQFIVGECLSGLFVIDDCSPLVSTYQGTILKKGTTF